MTASPDLAALVSAIEEVPFSSDEPTHRRVVTALSRLADVVRILDEAAARDIERLTASLMRSPPSERTHADLVKQALERALDAIAETFPASPDSAVRDAYVSARRATGHVAGATPLRQQALEVAAALRALANVAALVHDAPPPFVQPDADVQVGHDAAKLRERADRASTLVLELAKERDWKRSGARAARALDALAGVVEVAPLSLRQARWRSLVAAIRYGAMELEREGAVSLERSDHVKAALLACVQAFDALPRSAGQEPVRALASTATNATAAIDPHVTFVFQRGIVQEALRAVTDTFIVVSTQRASSSTSASR